MESQEPTHVTSSSTDAGVDGTEEKDNLTPANSSSMDHTAYGHESTSKPPVQEQEKRNLEQLMLMMDKQEGQSEEGDHKEELQHKKLDKESHQQEEESQQGECQQRNFEQGHQQTDQQVGGERTEEQLDGGQQENEEISTDSMALDTESSKCVDSNFNRDSENLQPNQIDNNDHHAVENGLKEENSLESHDLEMGRINSEEHLKDEEIKSPYMENEDEIVNNDIKDVTATPLIPKSEEIKEPKTDIKTDPQTDPKTDPKTFQEDFPDSGEDTSINKVQKNSDNLNFPDSATQHDTIEMTSFENGSAEEEEPDETMDINEEELEKNEEDVNVENEANVPASVRLYKRRSDSFNNSHIMGRRRHGGNGGNSSRNETSRLVLDPESESSPSTSLQTPHDLFIELHQLEYSDGQGVVWKERARWIKFEEDIEEGSDRWGKPHVASLTFHSLLELKRGLQDQGVVMLDCKLIDLAEIFESVAKQLFCSGLVTVDGKKKVLQMLSQKVSTPRRHSYPFDPRHGRERRGSVFHRLSTKGHDHQHQAFNGDYTSVPITVDFCQPPSHMPKDSKDSIMRKIPEDSEAAMVMVAADDTETLNQSVMALVRLTKPTVYQGFTEVPIPLRFLFITICRSREWEAYFEIGRSLSTLLSDPYFRKCAYRATSLGGILKGIDRFLDRTMVLPPGEWDRELLEPILRHREKTVHAQNKARSEHFSSARLTESDIKSILEKQRQKEESGLGFLKRTGRVFGGLVNEVKQRYPLIISDIKDGFNIQCLISFMCLYFACLAPAVAFGGLLGEKTYGTMGVSEMIISTGLCGMIFAMFSGQPLIIIGATGPMLVFEENLYKFCETLHVDFLTWRVWIGVWILVIALTVVAAEGSALIHYFTRFTEEIFATLISLIFIYETYKSLYHVLEENPFMMEYCSASSVDCSLMMNASYEVFAEITILDEGTSHHEFTDLPTGHNPEPSHGEDISKSHVHDEEEAGDGGSHHDHDPYPNTALMSIILTLGTFFVAYFLRDFKNSTFLGRKARRMIGDFSIAIAIFLMVLLDYGINNIYTAKLPVSSNLGEGRSIIIHPLGTKDHPMNVKMIFAAAIPAFMVFILLYIEILLTGVVVNKKENKLKKGSGYHIDLLIMGGLSFFAGFLGLPWMCAATVRTVSHVSSVSTFTHSSAPGVKPKLENIKEQRVTGFMVSFLIGLSVFMSPILREVPVAVVYGVFIYLGFCSLSSLQFISRLKILFMPSKYHPDVSYVRMVKTWRIHMFTIIQFLCLVGLWVVKMSPVAIAFPFFLMLLVPVRHFLKKFVYSEREINALDNEEEEKEDGNSDEHF